jgi:hypothetical protein|tara:strand:+ start:546 stop:878 length:333 start_codon:yes stop_codon:yes gene_type:complete
VTFIWFSLISYGLTQILVYGKILNPIRPKSGKLGQLLECPMCTGFWVGLFLWSVKDYTQLFTFDNSFVTGLLLGFAGSAAAYVGNTLFGDEGLKVEKLVHVRRRENETIY